MSRCLKCLSLHRPIESTSKEAVPDNHAQDWLDQPWPTYAIPAAQYLLSIALALGSYQDHDCETCSSIVAPQHEPLGTYRI